MTDHIATESQKNNNDYLKEQGTNHKLKAEITKLNSILIYHQKAIDELSEAKKEIFELKYTRSIKENSRSIQSVVRSFGETSIWLQQAIKTQDIRSKDEVLIAIQNVSKSESIVFSLQAACGIVKDGMRKGLVVINSAYEFQPAYNQRPIAIAKEACAAGYFVIFISWQWSRDEILKQSGHLFGGSLLQIDRFDLDKLIEILDEEKIENGTFILTIPSEDFVNSLPKFQSVGFRTIYDVMDDWDEFHSVGQAAWWTAELEQKSVLSADLVTAVSPSLTDKITKYGRDVEWVANGLRPTHRSEQFVSSRSSNLNGTIVLGYFGHLTEAWFDWTGIIELASNHKNVVIRIIGYGEPKWAAEKIKLIDNIDFIGFVPAHLLWEKVSDWHIGIIPFLPTELTRGVDPIKIYEYLNFGLPVLSSGMPHLEQYPESKVVTSWADSFNSIVDLYGKIIDRNIDYTKMADFCKESTWSKRFKAMVKSDA